MSVGPKILVVDDDATTQRLIVDTLADGNYVIETARDGVQAVEQAKRAPPDLLILDVVMPKMNGLEVCRIVKTSSEHFIPIILVTSRGDVDSRVTGLKLGADDYLAKPFNPAELQARVASMLRIKQLQDKLIAKRQAVGALSVNDELTGLMGHRAMTQRLREEFARSQRHNDPLALLAVDLDNFKAINDQFGHSAGDRVLEKMARLLTRAVREIDAVARHGSDEFLVILPQTHFAGALTVGDRICRAASQAPWQVGREQVAVTVSVGAAFFPNKNVVGVDDLVELAFAAMGQAKAEGRNRLCLHQHLNYLHRPELPTGGGS